MKWNSFDTRWMLSLFGTAVGAGILYLPIKAGVGGFWPVVAMTILTFPMVWLSHRALSRFCIEQNRVDNDITHAVEEYWGRKASFLITILYFFAIYPICLLYGVGITNTFVTFFYNQAGFHSMFIDGTDSIKPLFRAIIAFVLVSAMMITICLRISLIHIFPEKTAVVSDLSGKI